LRESGDGNTRAWKPAGTEDVGQKVGKEQKREKHLQMEISGRSESSVERGGL